MNLFGRRGIGRQRGWTKFHLVFAAARFAIWTVLIVLYLAGVPFTSELFRSVAFVAVLSIYANAMTDLGISIGAYAGLIAADARKDVHGAGEAVLRQILATQARTLAAVEAMEDRELN